MRHERYILNSRDQKEGEAIDTYVGELRTLAQSCNFCACLHDTLIRDRMDLGIRDGGTRKRLLHLRKLTLQKCIEIAKSDEISNTQIKNMDQTTTEDVHKVKTTTPKKTEHKYPKQTGRKYPYRKPDDDKMSMSNKPCDFCGRKHRKGRANCAAWGRVCGACGRKKPFRVLMQTKRKDTMSKLKKTTLARKNFFIV